MLLGICGCIATSSSMMFQTIADMVVAYHKLGGLPMHPHRGAPKRASVGRLLFPGEAAFLDVRLGLVGAPPVRARLPRVPVQMSASRVLSSRSGMCTAQAHDRAARTGRRAGL